MMRSLAQTLVVQVDSLHADKRVEPTVAIKIVTAVVTDHTSLQLMHLRLRRTVAENTSAHRVSAIAPRVASQLLTKQLLN
jgi:hypothetical protein